MSHTAERKTPRRLSDILPVIVVVVLVALIGLGYALTIQAGAGAEVNTQGDADRTLSTFHRVDDYPLYVMTYYGDYGFDGYLQTGDRRDSIRDPEPGESCSTFTAATEDGDMIFGRNFDWMHQATLLLFTDSPTGYASVSMVDIEYLGVVGTREPAQADLVGLLEAPYWPIDGMNEHGLAVSLMAVPGADLKHDPTKMTLDSLEVIRLLLDYARNVDEAVELIQDYNIDWGNGPELHYMVADRSGDSAVIEFVEGEVVVLRSNDPWQISTNFTISGTDVTIRPSLCDRYATALEVLGEANGILSQEEAMHLLASISQSSTEWSILYNLTSGDIQIVMGRKYDQAHSFSLEMAEE